MIDTLLSHLAPHHCCGCNEIGHVLCDNCKYNITSDMFSGCIVCGSPTSRSGVCGECNKYFVQGWCVGERVDELKRLIDAYKFNRVKAAYSVLGELLSERIGQLPHSTIVIPVPTVAAHVRSRGYDHTVLVARSLAKRQGLAVKKVLRRITATKQRGANRSDRFLQAEAAFATKYTVDPDVPYLLIDDVITTGATLQYAARTLASAGAQEIWVGVVARQPLD